MPVAVLTPGAPARSRRAGVRECVIWRTEEEAVDWWVLEDDEYHPLPVGSVDSHSVQGRAGSRGSAPRALGWTGPIRGLTVRA
jgi:hypothetical protein